ncbi:MAG TPA: molybdenum cofactor biosynthesis protein B [Polyangiaceae bacterium]|nr:molybdenum cofactor biosynthesis protein B [Polyangiaceae bacterium]
MEQKDPEVGLRISVITVSDTRTLETDKSGQILVEFVHRDGHQLVQRVIIKDDLLTIRDAVAQSCAAGDVDAVLLTGGTGITERDVTPEAIAPLVTKHIAGFGELFRMLSYADIGAATIQSRAFAALCGQVLVFALPGSTGAVQLAVDKIIAPQLDRATKPCNFAQLLPRIRHDPS